MKSLIVVGMLAAGLLFVSCSNENTPVGVEGLNPKSESTQRQTVHRSRTEYHGTLWNNCAGAGEYIHFTGTQVLTWVESVLDDGTVRTEKVVSIKMTGVGAESGLQYSGTQKGNVLVLQSPPSFCPYTEDTDMTIKFGAAGTAYDAVHRIHTHTTVACDKSRDVEVLEDSWVCD